MAAPASSVRAVVLALLGNGFVTTIKLVAFLASGSGAMLSEAIHSAADTGNQLLLYLGLRRSARERDREFHYGYGGDRFVFGLLSAAGIFFIGCGVTVQHGIHALLHPRMPTLDLVPFVVLGISLLVEGAVLVAAIRGVAAERGEMPLVRYVREKADPATVAILLEDGAAVLGVLLAAGGIGLARLTGEPRWDSVSSILVGLLLGAVALYLVMQNRALLLGRAVPPDVADTFVRVLRDRASVRDVHDVKTRQLTPEVYKLKAEVTFDSSYLASQLERVLAGSTVPAGGSERDRAIQRVAEAAVVAMAEEIDRIELEVRAAIPAARHIDIEVHRPAQEVSEPSRLRAE